MHPSHQPFRPPQVHYSVLNCLELSSFKSCACEHTNDYLIIRLCLCLCDWQLLADVDVDKTVKWSTHDSYVDTLESYKGHMPPTLAHGDMWCNNAMFERVKDSVGNKLVAIIDWQSAHIGHPLEDLGRVLSFSTHSSVFRDHMEVSSAL